MIESNVLSAARMLFHTGDVVEIRVPKAGRQRTISGYFDNLEKLAEAVGQLEKSRPPFPGIYWTLNPVNRAALSRAENKVRSFADDTTKDLDILTRRLLGVDFDPIRLAGISSTETEHQAALDLAALVRKELLAEGWPDPIVADSGNGAHLLYLIDLPNDSAAADLLKRILYALANRFDTPVVTVDKTTYNASRIFKVYGTTARKGDNTAERPHRLSRILQVPALLTPVTGDLLRALAASAPIEAKPQPSRPSASYSSGVAAFSLDQFLSRHGIRHRAPVPHEGGRKFVLDHCPFDPSHKAPDAAVFERSDGYGFKCFHNSCAGRDWKEFRELFEPRRSTTHMGPRPEARTVEEQPSSGEAPDEVSLTAEDIHGAIDEAIAADDMVACLRMLPNIAKLAMLDHSIIKAKLKKAFGDDFSAKEFEKLIREEIKAALGSGDGQEKNPSPSPPWESGGEPPEVPDLRYYPLTDGGNGERIVALFGKDIRFCSEMKKWLVWNGVRWAVDEFNVMRQKGKQMARLLYAQSAKEDTPEKLRGPLDKHARASEMYSAISNALGQAATEPGIPISALDLDRHAMLLNCPNGIVDLSARPPKLIEQRREFLLTKLCPVEYHPEAKCPQFMEFVHWAMGAVEDRELTEHTKHLVAFLSRAFGYALTGNVSTRVVFVFYGEGKNGKSTLLSLFRCLLGEDYSGELLIDTVMSMNKQDATARADLADLRGSRFVMTTEVEKEHRLKEGTIKSITAGIGSRVKSCKKYENPITFPAEHKLFMDCNHRPQIKGADKAIWDRMRLVPFDVRIPEDQEDAELPNRLRTELQGVLAWAVKGCLAWQEEGLGNPPEVAKAGKEWQEHDDPLKEFLEDACNIEDDLFVAVSDLMAGYLWWCKENSEKWPRGRQDFNEHLYAKNFKQERRWMTDDSGTKKQTRIWEGIELKTYVTSAIRSNKSSAWQPREI